MRFLSGSGFSVVLALALVSVGKDASACPPLPPGLLADARPLNLGAPIPENGAIVFLLECWHDCTPCAAAEQRLDITVTDGRGSGVRGDKPEQVFLTEDGLSHLVLWRPADAPSPGDYTVTVGVTGQPERNSYPFTIVAPIAEPDAASVVAATVTTYEVERGTLYGCDQSQTDCGYDSLGFGSQYELLPALDLMFGSGAVDASSGQLLYHVLHHSTDGTTHWGSWRLAANSSIETVRFVSAQTEYCADTEVRSLLADGVVTAESPCKPHGDLQAPLTGDSDITSSLEACIRPPRGLEPEWCAIHSPECTGGATSIACQEVALSCVEPVSRGAVSAPASYADTTTTESDELCPSADDPYDESIAGCTCRVSTTRRLDPPLGSAFTALALWFARRAFRRVPKRAARSTRFSRERTVVHG